MKKKTRFRVKKSKADDFFNKGGWDYDLTDKQRAGAIRRAMGGRNGGAVTSLLREVCERALDSMAPSITRDAFIDGVKYAFGELWEGSLHASFSSVSDDDIMVEVWCYGRSEFPGGLFLSLGDLFAHDALEFENADEARRAVAFLRRHADTIEEYFKSEKLPD